MPYPGKPRPEIADLHNRAFAAGVPIARVLERSGHSWATWSRLKRGGKAQAVTLDRLTKALDAVLAEQQGNEPDGATPR